jgi:hypothetical protein
VPRLCPLLLSFGPTSARSASAYALLTSPQLVPRLGPLLLYICPALDLFSLAFAPALARSSLAYAPPSPLLLSLFPALARFS